MSYTTQNFADDVQQALRRIQSLTPSDTPANPLEMNPETGTPEQQKIYCGRITDTLPQLRLYKVQIPQEGMRLCAVAEQTGGLLSSAMGFAAGDLVIVLGASGSSDGLILGRVPGTSRYGRVTPRSFITLSDHFQPTVLDRSVRELDPEKPFPSRVIGLPVHSAEAGEFFIGSCGGPRLFTDPFMAFLSANDATGVWAFRDDAMLRTAGVNYQKVTAGSFEERLNRNGECTEYEGHALHAWESFGYPEKPEVILEEKENWEKSETPQAFVEPKVPDAKPVHRITEFGGWLGYGKQSHVTAPPETLSKYGEKAEGQPALSKISQLADGFIGLESVKGISIVKRSRMPAVQQLELPIANPEYQYEPLSGEPEFQSDDSLMQSLMTVADYSAYVFNYKTLYPFLWNTEEYFVPEDSSLPGTDYSLKEKLPQLRHNFMLPPPEPYVLTLDGAKHRFYPVEAGIHLLPDGGVVIQDGYGAELRMTGGQITLSAPGGVWLRSGKDLNLWAGRDMNVLTKKAVDITASEGAVRVKAEKNLELLGGNAGDASGVILESRGKGAFDFAAGGDGIQTGGMVIRASEGTVATYGKSIYTRSGVTGGGQGIFLDAGDGKENITSLSANHTDRVSGRYEMQFGRAGVTDTDSVLQVSSAEAFLPGTLKCGGSGSFQGSVDVGENIFCGAHIQTKGAVSNPRVNPLKDRGAQAFDQRLRDMRVRMEDTNPEEAGSRMQALQEQWKGEKAPGNEEVLRKAGFSYRTDEELKLDGFQVYADRWQTVCDTGVASLDVKKVTTASGKGEYPWPGKKYWEDEDCFVTQTLVFIEDGALKARQSGERPVGEYVHPKYNKPEVQSLKSFPVLD